MGRLASKRTWTTLAVAASVACSDAAQSSFAGSDDRAGASAESADPAPEQRRACTPDVSGLTPSGIEPIEIACPRGYAEREALAALPIAGRFSTQEELIEAFCVAEGRLNASAADPRAPAAEASIDFATSDVVAYAFDAHAGATPTLFVRGDELWLRITSTACSGEAPTLASVAFVIPKSQAINEQRCSATCR
ncbi:MAG: hypothetical protein KF795_33340 [Labilithrix sp.]|nr:hypothetical protein [Labilithrix sp.]